MHQLYRTRNRILPKTWLKIYIISIFKQHFKEHFKEHLKGLKWKKIIYEWTGKEHLAKRISKRIF